jgi:hypothetical protein
MLSHLHHFITFPLMLCLYSYVNYFVKHSGHLSKESYRLCKKYYETKKETRAQQRAVETLINE